MKANFSTILPYFSLNITLRSLYCNFKCSNILCSSMESQIIEIKLFTISWLWDIKWKPYINILPRRPPYIYTIWPTKGEKLQQLQCYHPFSDSRDTYLTKNHYENYSLKMVPIAKIWGSGSWTSIHLNKIGRTHHPSNNAFKPGLCLFLLCFVVFCLFVLYIYIYINIYIYIGGTGVICFVLLLLFCLFDWLFDEWFVWSVGRSVGFSCEGAAGVAVRWPCRWAVAVS